MEKSLDLRTWRYEQGGILNKDVMARSKINMEVFSSSWGALKVHTKHFSMLTSTCVCAYIQLLMVLSGAQGASLHLTM